MSNSLLTVLVMAGISGLLLGLGTFVRPLRRVCGAVCLLWMVAALPILMFRNVPSDLTLLFYILSAVLGLIFNLGGKPA